MCKRIIMQIQILKFNLDLEKYLIIIVAILKLLQFKTPKLKTCINFQNFVSLQKFKLFILCLNFINFILTY